MSMGRTAVHAQQAETRTLVLNKERTGAFGRCIRKLRSLSSELFHKEIRHRAVGFDGFRQNRVVAEGVRQSAEDHQARIYAAFW